MRNTGAYIQKGSADWESKAFQQAKSRVCQCNKEYILTWKIEIDNILVVWGCIVYHIAYRFGL